MKNSIDFTFLDEYGNGIEGIGVISDVNGELLTDSTGTVSFPIGDQIFTMDTNITPNVPIDKIFANCIFTKFTNYIPRPANESTDNILTVASFNDDNEALDSNGKRIVIYKNGTPYVLKPSTVLGEGDKLVAVVTVIN